MMVNYWFHHNAICVFRCIILSLREIVCSGIIPSAKCGRTLPRLTVILAMHIPVHLILTTSNRFNNIIDSSSGIIIHQLSLYFIVFNMLLNICGYVFLVMLYRHSIKTIFNREIPTLRRDSSSGCILPEAHPAVKSFNTHLSLLRPLEILFRFVTAPLRVLPDAIILGETRCGTTNLCGHIVSVAEASSSFQVSTNEGMQRIKCYTPFCPWAHPILDHKESFYFVGHYLGIVDPYFYRMAFPLKVNRESLFIINLTQLF